MWWKSAWPRRNLWLPSILLPSLPSSFFPLNVLSVTEKHVPYNVNKKDRFFPSIVYLPYQNCPICYLASTSRSPFLTNSKQRARMNTEPGVRLWRVQERPLPRVRADNLTELRTWQNEEGRRTENSWVGYWTANLSQSKDINMALYIIFLTSFLSHSINASVVWLVKKVPLEEH